MQLSYHHAINSILFQLIIIVELICWPPVGLVNRLTMNLLTLVNDISPAPAETFSSWL